LIAWILRSVKNGQRFVCLYSSRLRIDYKKLSCRQGTARRAVLDETTRNVSQMPVELRFKSLTTGDHLQVIQGLEMARIDRLL